MHSRDQRPPSHITHPLGLRIGEVDHAEREQHAPREENPHPAVHGAIHRERGVLRREPHGHGEDVGDGVPPSAEAGRVDLGGEHVDDYAGRVSDASETPPSTKRSRWCIRTVLCGSTRLGRAKGVGQRIKAMGRPDGIPTGLNRLSDPSGSLTWGEEHNPQEPLYDIHRDETRPRRMVLYPLIEYPQGQRALYDQAHTSLARAEEVVGASPPVIKQVPADDPAHAPARVLHPGDPELDVRVGDPRGGEDDGVVVGEYGLAVPCCKWWWSANQERHTVRLMRSRHFPVPSLRLSEAGTRTVREGKAVCSR
jgi:hypothetical protein